jgi:hypothetical protein
MKNTVSTYLKIGFALLLILFSTHGSQLRAQELGTAYFTDSYTFRHTMNPAFAPSKGYVAIPVLGNLNMSMQGNLHMDALLYPNPEYGVVKGAEKTATFMHPAISADEALSNFNKGSNQLLMDLDVTLASVGFEQWGGFNTIELKQRTNMGVSLPYELFEMAKDLGNRSYDITDMSMRVESYTELAMGHSRQLTDNLRAGAKVKLLFGTARADLEIDHLHASFEGNQWVLEGEAKGEVNLHGASFKQSAPKEYKSHEGTYQQVNGLNNDGFGISGFGAGIDLGAVYSFRHMGMDWLDGLTLSAALTDLGFISWGSTLVARNAGEQFVFDGFHDVAVKTNGTGGGFTDQSDSYSDQLADFAHLVDESEQGSTTTMLAATMKLGAEYELPMYKQLSFGLLGTHRFNGDYSWTEGRLSANWKALNWFDAAVSLSVGSYGVSMGWITSFHPKGVNIFLAMDHTSFKTTANLVPLNSNVGFAMGVSVNL